MVRKSTFKSWDLNTKSRKMFETILNHVSEGVLAINREGIIISLNKTGGDILFLKPEEAVGKHITEVLDFKPNILDVLSTGKGFTDKALTIRTKHGKINLVKSAIPVIGEEGVIEAVVDVFKEVRNNRPLPAPSHGMSARYRFEDIIGSSKEILEIKKQAYIVAGSDSNILITGDSGTGKELLAQAIHNQSARARGPFVAVNCGAIPRELIESELFGYEYGSFTGARQGGSPGKFELASGGTIFLDEIGEMPTDMQVRLLRVLQEKQINRIGGGIAIPVDIRVIAATNKDLNWEMANGAFRADLYWRINVLHINIPPLVQRKGDIITLTNYFIDKYSALRGVEYKIDSKTMDILMSYDWPGNVRELENTIERAVNFCPASIILPEHLPIYILSKTRKPGKTSRAVTIKEAEREVIYEAVRQCSGNITKAASILGISRNTLYSKMIKYKIPNNKIRSIN